MDKPQPAELTWSVNPWHTNWKRPAAAMAVCIVVALLAGFSFNYPNYSALPPAPGQAASDGSAANQGDESNANAIATDPELWLYRAAGTAIISLALLLGMTGMIYLPARYKLDENGVTGYLLGVPTFRPWRHYRNFYVHQNGVHLTTMPKPSPLDAFRGHFLQFYGNRDEVVAYIDEHMTLRGVPEGQEPDGEGKSEP